ncbi:MAG: nucleotidyl transferase AbiEii/AbiGii toxin family protein [Chitinophagales bacterium]|nr:nucleotidyl transferase AbiEii/AbiGii toxin family protein [Chitinophagales bacterium]
MLTFREIQQFYPLPLQGFQQFLLREYLQCKILALLFESAFAEKFAFLGGTCLRLIHQNNRFSEDLDFDNFHLSSDEFALVSDALRIGLEKEGLEVEMRNVMRGAYHCYIKFPNLLFETGLSGHREEKILIQLDTEAQYFPFVPQTTVLNRFDVFTVVNTTPLDILLSQKLYAICNRKQPKGRDFFDATFLFARTLPNYEYLEMKLGVSNREALREKMIAVVEMIDLDAAARDVQPFLFYPQDIARVRFFGTFIREAKL